MASYSLKNTSAPSKDKIAFSLNLKRLRVNANIKQAQLALLCGVSIRAWGAWESMSQPTWPPADMLPRIANELQCTINDLFGGSPDWLPQTADERYLFGVIRKSKLPSHQIVHVMINALDKMTANDRRLWVTIGHRLRKNIKT
ncbi:MAG: helix-turn-helix transcriptional regulator [Colwellia sp.]